MEIRFGNLQIQLQQNQIQLKTNLVNRAEVLLEQVQSLLTFLPQIHPWCQKMIQKEYFLNANTINSQRPIDEIFVWQNMIMSSNNWHTTRCKSNWKIKILKNINWIECDKAMASLLKHSSNIMSEMELKWLSIFFTVVQFYLITDSISDVHILRSITIGQT